MPSPSSAPITLSPPRPWPTPPGLQAAVQPYPAVSLRDLARPAERFGFQVWVALVAWVFFLFEPQWLVASFRPLLKVPMLLVLGLAVSLMARPKPGEWFPALLLWVTATGVNLPLALNPANAMVPLKALVTYWLLAVCTIRVLRSPRTVTPVLFMLCVGQYVWWAFHGLKTGAVDWHPNNANFDAYGPLMAVGIGPAYFYAQATPNRWLRRLGFLTAGLCVAGVVSSFARGAVLSAVVTIAYVWLRSPQKWRTFKVIVVALLITTIVAGFVSGLTRGNDTRPEFWSEMATMFDQGEGTTGEDRQILWSLAERVYLQHPILGAGAENFGAVASSMVEAGEVGGQYGDNPATLYDRALHSNYFQLLSEFGTVGVIAFAWIVGGFWWRNQALRRPASRDAWHAAGGRESLMQLSLGLEAGMVAYLVTGLFYNQLFVGWFFALLIANALLHRIVQQATTPAPRRRAAPPTARTVPLPHL